jgi:hypothetical protein
MSSAFSFPENCKIVEATPPAVGAAAVITFDYISLKNAHKAWIVIQYMEGHAAAITYQPMKATAVAPTNATAITTVAKIWSNLATAVSDTLVERTAAVLYAHDAAAANKLVIFEIDPADLGDLAGVPYDCISCTATTPQAGDYISALYVIQPRYASAVASQPTVITD